MSLRALFIVAKNYKQFKCPSTGKWIKEMWYIYTMKYKSALKTGMNYQGMQLHKLISKTVS